ncbi:MAG: hypothetical protein WCK28_23065, partial [Burkholderiales bacterium]
MRTALGLAAAPPLEQVLLWLGPASTALLCLDESHMAKNAVPLTVETEMESLLERGVKRAERVIARMIGAQRDDPAAGGGGGG